MTINRELLADGWHYLEPDQHEFAVTSAVVAGFDISGMDSFILGEQGLTLNGAAVELLLAIRGDAFDAFKDDDRRAWPAHLRALFWACVAHGMEPNAVRGRENLEATIKATEAKKARSAENKRKVSELYSQLAKEHPRWSKGRIEQEITKNLKVSERVIRDYVKARESAAIIAEARG